jgi:hypothetical protein
MSSYLFNDYVFYLLFGLVIAPRVSTLVLPLFILFLHVRPEESCDGAWCGLTNSVEYIVLVPLALTVGGLIYASIRNQKIRYFFIKNYAGLNTLQRKAVIENETIRLNLFQRLAVSWRVGLLFIASLWLFMQAQSLIMQMIDDRSGKGKIPNEEPVPALESYWEKMDYQFGKNQVEYLNTKNIKKEGKYISFESMTVFLDDSEKQNFNSNKNYYRSIIEVELIDCKQLKSKPLETKYYAQKNGINLVDSKGRLYFSDWEFESINANPALLSQGKTVCAKAVSLGIN